MADDNDIKAELEKPKSRKKKKMDGNQGLD